MACFDRCYENMIYFDLLPLILSVLNDLTEQ